MPLKKAGDSWYEVVDQSKTCSCSMACCSMVLRMARNFVLAEKDLLNQATVHRGPQNYEAHGASIHHVVAVLEKWKVKSTPYWASGGHGVHQLLSFASPQKPAILCLDWSVGGKHMIVSPGLNKSGTGWIALDPGDWGTGAVASEQPVANLPTYSYSGITGTITNVILAN